jgi:hypothetical protein
LTRRPEHLILELVPHWIAPLRPNGRTRVTDDSASLDDGKAKRFLGESVGVTTERDVESVCTDSSEHGRIESTDALVHRLLVAYGVALDSIAVKPAIVFLPRRSISQQWFSRHILLPHANFMAKLLAEAHVAARVDGLLRRGQRFRALDPQGHSPLDLDRLQDFRNSLSPVTRRSLTLWIVLLTLAVAFPVAVTTDYLRTLTQEAIVCTTSRFSVQHFVAKVTGTGVSPSRCRVFQSRDTLVEALDRLAHVNLSPGSVIDTVRSIRASGLVVVLLLAVIWILSLSVVLLVFRSGFRLKRLAFSGQQMLPDGDALLMAGIRSDGLYTLEPTVYRAAGVRWPREFPLDLAVSAGLLVLPLTIAADLLISVRLFPTLGLVTTATLTAVALGLIVIVPLRLGYLVRVWRSRTGLKVIESPKRWLPDGSAVRVHNGAYGAVLLAAVYGFWLTLIAVSINSPVPVIILWVILGAPLLAWPFGMLWWYRLHRELASCGRCLGISLVRAPILSVIPPLSLAVALIINVSLASHYNSGNVTYEFVALAVVVLLIIGCVGFPVSIYRMGRILGKLRSRAMPHTVWKARATGLRATAMFFLPFVVIPYFQQSLNQIWREIGTLTPPLCASASDESPYRWSDPTQGTLNSGRTGV